MCLPYSINRVYILSLSLSTTIQMRIVHVCFFLNISKFKDKTSILNTILTYLIQQVLCVSFVSWKCNQYRYSLQRVGVAPWSGLALLFTLWSGWQHVDLFLRRFNLTSLYERYVQIVKLRVLQTMGKKPPLYSKTIASGT